MNEYDVWAYKTALMMHFTSKYDFFKFRGKAKTINVDTFNKRAKPLWAYKELANHFDPKGKLLANIIQNPKVFIIDLVNDEKSENVYREWARVNQSFTYIFKQEISLLKDDFNSNFKVEDGQHPFLLKLYMKKKISLETLTVLYFLADCHKQWNCRMGNDIIWKDLEKIITKYYPFLKYDQNKFTGILLNHFEH